jgi:hypothetical protein
MESPPSGSSIIVGVMIADKFFYIWHPTKQFAEEDKIKADDKVEL